MTNCGGAALKETGRTRPRTERCRISGVDVWAGCDCVDGCEDEQPKAKDGFRWRDSQQPKRREAKQLQDGRRELGPGAQLQGCGGLGAAHQLLGPMTWGTMRLYGVGPSTAQLLLSEGAMASVSVAVLVSLSATSWAILSSVSRYYVHRYNGGLSAGQQVPRYSSPEALCAPARITISQTPQDISCPKENNCRGQLTCDGSQPITQHSRFGTGLLHSNDIGPRVTSPRNGNAWVVV